MKLLLYSGREGGDAMQVCLFGAATVLYIYLLLINWQLEIYYLGYIYQRLWDDIILTAPYCIHHIKAHIFDWSRICLELSIQCY